MIDYKSLRAAQPDLHMTAGRTWRDWAEKLDLENKGMRDRIIGEVFNGDVWDDKAADAARDHIEGLMRGIGKSYDDLDLIGEALTKFGRRLGEMQHLLLQNVHRAEAEDLTVTAQGEVIPPKGKVTAKAAAQWTAFVDDCQKGIDTAINEAQKADRECAGKLGEHAAALPTIKQLNTASDKLGHQGLQAAKLAQQLLSQSPGELSRQELERLHNLLRNADDPAFSTQFLEALGPEKALRLNVLFAQAAGEMGGGFRQLGAGLQDDLAQAIASATDKTAGHHVTYTDSTDFTGEDHVRQASWMDQLKEAGRAGQGMGYQSLAVLLDDAKFSTDFLNEVGQDMYRYDVTEGLDPRSGVDGGLDLDLGDPNETGQDPMSGLMEGLANNPEAAQEFFTHEFDDLPPDAQNPVDYLLTGREWDDGPGTSNLGEALESATTTVRNHDAASIMGQAVHSLGSSSVTMPANMRDSFGHMISTWIDDVNHGIGGWVGDDQKSIEDWTIESGDTHAYFKSEEILEVMGQAAKDPDAYQEMWDHQRAYTAMTLDSDAAQIAAADSPDAKDDAEAAFNADAEVAAQVFGALNQANADAAQQLAQQSVAGLETAQVVSNYGMAAAAGAAGTFAAGPMGAAAMSVASQGAGFAVNEAFQNMKHAATADNYENIEAIYGNGERAVQQLVESAIWRNEAYGHVPETIPNPDQPGQHLEYPSDDPVRLVDAAGNPIPYEEMNEYQKEAYRSWMQSQGQAQDLLSTDLTTAIQTGRDRMKDASLPGPGGHG